MSVASFFGEFPCYSAIIESIHVAISDQYLLLIRSCCPPFPFQDDTYTESYISTIGVDFVSESWMDELLIMTK